MGLAPASISKKRAQAQAMAGCARQAMTAPALPGSPLVGGVSKTSRSAQAVPDPAQGAGATVPVPALRGQAQAKQPSCISPAQPSANT